jgi:hypothetical protein
MPNAVTIHEDQFRRFGDADAIATLKSSSFAAMARPFIQLRKSGELRTGRPMKTKWCFW